MSAPENQQVPTLGASRRSGLGHKLTDLSGNHSTADCHFLCVIGTGGDHHGTLEYRCVDANGYVLPFDGGDNMHPFGCDCPDCPEVTT